MKERPGEEFMFRTRYEFSGPSDQQLGKRQPPLFRRHPAAGEPILLRADDEAIARKVSVACLGQAIVATSAVTFIWTAVPYRMTWRYGQRGYRYLHLDAGHVCQNLYQAAEALAAGCCPSQLSMTSACQTC
jgi:nitroreductase